MSTTSHIPLEDAGPTINDVMLREPETVGPAFALDEARRLLSARKKLLLVADGEQFLGTVTAAELPAGDGPIGPHVRADTPRLSPDDPTARALELLETEGMSRIPVVDGADRLLGLVCFNTSHEAFCI